MSDFEGLFFFAFWFGLKFVFFWLHETSLSFGGGIEEQTKN